jgi:hypothetical protein
MSPRRSTKRTLGQHGMGLWCDRDCNSQCRRWIKQERKVQENGTENKWSFPEIEKEAGLVSWPGAFGSFGGSKKTSTSKAISC